MVSTPDPATIVRHVRTCAACRLLSQHALRTRDPRLVDAALQLRAEHLANESEREGFMRELRAGRRSR